MFKSHFGETAIVSAANIFYNETIPVGLQMEEWVQGFVHDWPITFVISYLAAFAAEATGKWVAEKYCGYFICFFFPA